MSTVRKAALPLFCLLAILIPMGALSAADAQTKPQKRSVAKHRTKTREREREAVTVVRHGKKIVLSEDEDLKRTDQPAEAVQSEVDARLPKGSKTIPIERYFRAKEKMKSM